MEDSHWPRASSWLARADRSASLQVVGVPSSRASISGSRADKCPGALRSRLRRFSTFDGETGVDLGDVAVFDHGDWPVADLGAVEMIEEVQRLAEGLDDRGLTLFIGGDNAITRPLVRASGPLGETGVITFDAHHDVRTLAGGPSNGTPIRGLIEDGLPGRHVTQLGIHSFANSAAYRRYCDQQGISVVTMADIDRTGIGSAVEDALANISTRRIHVDVDIDVLDRAFAPACPGSRPGGMTVRQLAAAVRMVVADERVTSVDFVELDPDRDIDGLTLDALATVFLAAVSGFAERSRR